MKSLIKTRATNVLIVLLGIFSPLIHLSKWIEINLKTKRLFIWLIETYLFIAIQLNWGIPRWTVFLMYGFLIVSVLVSICTKWIDDDGFFAPIYAFIIAVFTIIFVFGGLDVTITYKIFLVIALLIINIGTIALIVVKTNCTEIKDYWWITMVPASILLTIISIMAFSNNFQLISY